MVRRLPLTISEKEFLEIYKAERDKTMKFIYLLGFYQCLRISEIVSLKPQQIDKDRGFIRIRGKGSKDADIPLVKPIEQALRWAYKLLPFGYGYSARSVQRAISAAGEEILGKKGITPHTLRHSGATHYLHNKKIDIRYVQSLLRHSRLDTTQIYTHLSPTSLKERFDEVF